MSVGLVVELERLAAEASLCRGQLEELGQLVVSYRQRVRDGLAHAGVTHDAIPAPPESTPVESLMPPPLPEVVQSLAPELEIEELPAPPLIDVPAATAPDPDSGWGPGGA